MAPSSHVSFGLTHHAIPHLSNYQGTYIPLRISEIQVFVPNVPIFNLPFLNPLPHMHQVFCTSGHVIHTTWNASSGQIRIGSNRTCFSSCKRGAVLYSKSYIFNYSTFPTVLICCHFGSYSMSVKTPGV